MCGIAGIIKWSHQKAAPWAPPQQEFNALAEMSSALAQRGPDGQGLWTDPRPCHTAALVHRRLAIIDLPGGHQPMGNEDGSVQVVFNGEIYNHAELRRELTAQGHRFASDHSDTEVLVHGWEQWGTGLPAKLRGMFALALWDTRTDTLFLARDRMGQKPLFYATLDDGLVFASTIPAVLCWPEVPRRVPAQQVALYLTVGFLPPPHTIYRDISQVLPGHWLRLRHDVLDGGKYWDYLEPPDVTEDVRAGLGRAVQSQRLADVPVACFLSGGIDSTIIAALLQQEAQRTGSAPIHTVSVGFADADYDETAFAQLAAAKLGTRHTVLQVNPHDDVAGTLDHLMARALGQPYADSSIIPTYHLSRAVRQLAPVALSGDGGDELFGGYDRYRAMPLLQRWAWLLRLGPASLPVGSLAKRELYRRLRHAAGGGDYAAGQYPRLLEIFSFDQVEALLGTMPPPVGELAADVGPRRYGMLFDQRNYLPGDVLWKVDCAAMAVGLEVRSPFLDHQVVALANRLPEADLIRGSQGKWMLRRMFADLLPPQIAARRKKGFGVPIGRWFNADLADLLNDTLDERQSFSRQYLDQPILRRLRHEHHAGTRDHTYRLFALLMLEIWWRQGGATLEQ